ncbi:MAG: hypothetical protein QNK30_09415 [Bacteroidales bacterium]|nr:hypothetical protein [Bacteroidales bacterium]
MKEKEEKIKKIEEEDINLYNYKNREEKTQHNFCKFINTPARTRIVDSKQRLLWQLIHVKCTVASVSDNSGLHVTKHNPDR